MNKETMNIHKALVELKTLESRTTKSISGATFIAANKHSNTKIGGKNIADYCEGIKDDYKSIRDLIKRRDAIKRAVVLSNATTKVTIGGVEYTVAEAIDMKNHGVTFLGRLMTKMAASYEAAQRTCDLRNEKLTDLANAHLADVFGSTDLKNASAEINAERDHYIEMNTYELVDPIGVKKVLEDLEDQINNFMSEVDAALSTSNATTEITIEY